MRHDTISENEWADPKNTRVLVRMGSSTKARLASGLVTLGFNELVGQPGF